MDHRGPLAAALLTAFLSSLQQPQQFPLQICTGVESQIRV
jgi:hypothetical protein